MIKLKKIKLSDMSDKQTLDVKKLSKITGGFQVYDGCSTGICVNNRDYGTSKYCGPGSAACTSGVDVCHEST